MRSLTTTDVARRPAPGTTVPTSIRFAPGGEVATYLVASAGSLRQSLVVVDVATGVAREVATPGAAVREDDLSIEERLRRERARELAVGVTRHQWADATDRVLVPMADGLWLIDGLAAGGDGAARLAVPATAVAGAVLDARLSADGTRIGFVAGDEVHVADVDTGSVVQVTSGAAGTGRTNGLAEYVAQEEMERGEGFWLSPDAARVAFCEVDETHIPVYRIVHQASDRVGEDAQEDHRYPFAGAANARVRVGVVPADGTGADRPAWLDLDATDIGEDRYVARVQWATTDTVIVQLQSRDQRRLDLVRYDLDPAGGERVPGTLLWTETSEVWINLHDVLRPLADGSLLWASERSGFRHLEVREPDGSLRHVLTEGPWVVTDVVGVGAEEVWFRSTASSPVDRAVHRVLLDGSAPATPLTVEPGVHGAVAHPDTGAWVHTWSTPDAPPRTWLRRSAEDAEGVLLHDAAADPRLAELTLVPPALRTVGTAPLAPDGDDTELHAAVFRPDGSGPFPTVVWVYGGPHAQLVTRSWSTTAAMRAQLLRQEGFCVAVVDGRGSTDRGLAFEGALRHRLGTVEVDDQVRLVEDLVADGTTDPERVGIYGWSYGGYLSALCLARRPDVFRAACAGAPVTSWDGYDTHYTERYLGTPAANPDGYRQASVMSHIEGLRDRHLLLIHGLIDENVHFRHTARLVDALVKADIDHRLVLYPDERHVPRGEADRVSMEQRILAFFRSTLT